MWSPSATPSLCRRTCNHRIRKTSSLVCPRKSGSRHFQTRILPIIVGKVESISRDRLVDEQTKQPYFLAQVVVDDIPSFVKDRLSAGMPADVIFPTGERTVLDYLVRPLKDRLRGVMRER